MSILVKEVTVEYNEGKTNLIVEIERKGKSHFLRKESKVSSISVDYRDPITNEYLNVFFNSIIGAYVCREGRQPTFTPYTLRKM